MSVPVIKHGAKVRKKNGMSKKKEHNLFQITGYFGRILSQNTGYPKKPNLSVRESGIFCFFRPLELRPAAAHPHGCAFMFAVEIP